MRERFVKVAIPEKGHPVVKRLFTEMNLQQIGLLDMAERSGVNKNTFRHWRTKSEPRVSDIDACLHVLGLRLTVGRTRVKDERQAGSTS